MQNTMYNNQNRTADAAMSAPASCCAREASRGIILDTAILAVSIFVISIISLLAILGLQVSLVLLVSGLLMQAILILVLLGRTNMPNRRNARFPVHQRRF